MTQQGLLNLILANLPDNIVQAIEPKDIRSVLDSIVNTLFQNIFLATAAYAGPAMPTTDPGDPVSSIFYIATAAGTYTNFLDSTSTAITVTDGEFAILSYNGTAWIKQMITIDLSDYVQNGDIVDNVISADANKPLSANQGKVLNDKLSLAVKIVDETSKLVNPGYISEADGTYVANAIYNSTDFIPVIPGQKITYNGYAGGSGSVVVCPVAGYNDNNVFVSAIISNPDPEGSGGLVNTTTFVPAGITKIKASLRQNEGDPQTLSISDAKYATEINSNSQSITQIQNAIEPLVSQQDVSDQVLTNSGYIAKADGNFVSAANYLSSDFIAVKAGDKVIYSGTAGSLVSPLAGYDADGNYLYNPLDITVTGSQTFLNEVIIIPDDIAKIKVSVRINEGDTHSFVKNTVTVKLTDLDTSSVEIPRFFMPPKIFGKTGEMIRMYPDGILSIRNLDVRWSAVGGNQSFWEISNPATADNNSTVSLKVYGLFGENKLIGTTKVQLVNTVVDPASPMCVLCIGDSLTWGVNASINSAWVNEFSRRLTGTGTGIGDVKPTPLNLSNIQFIGTLGSSPVKAEGRAGWSAHDYLIKADDNAFYNPSTSGFDIDYYLTQNGFYSPTLTGGVDGTGSNLVVYILLGWNDIRKFGVNAYRSDLATMVDDIIAKLPNVNIKLVGVEHPPANVYRTDKTDWSPRQIMEEYVIPQHETGAEIASTRTGNVEHLPVAAFFGEVDAFSTANNNANRRTTSQLSIATDNVHCNDNGYAQIADVAYYNFLFNYCNGD